MSTIGVPPEPEENSDFGRGAIEQRIDGSLSGQWFSIIQRPLAALHIHLNEDENKAKLGALLERRRRYCES